MRDKLPQYKDLDDDSLVDIVIKQYPVYESQVDLKKKDLTSDFTYGDDSLERTEDGKIKVTAAKFNLDAGEIDAEELLNEGVSPLIKRIKEALRRMTITFEEDKVSSLNKATDTNFG